MRRMCVVTLVAVVAACLMSCGKNGGGSGNYSSPKATFETMWAAAKAGNEKAMMACFSDACRAKMAEVEKLMADLPKEMKEGKGSVSNEIMTKAKTAKVELGAEKIDGDKATLEVTTDGDKETLDFIKEGGAWKMHIKDIAELDIDQMKKAMEMMKAMKGMMKGIK
jgi:hypothetical protein